MSEGNVQESTITQLTKKHVEAAILEELDELKTEEEIIGVKTDKELDDEIVTAAQFDVFEDIINVRIKKGERVQYSVAVDNIIAASGISKISSWNEIHKKYAPIGGFVLVKPRTASGTWLKQQGQTFGAVNGGELNEKEDDKGFSARDYMEMQSKSEERFTRQLAQARAETKQAADEKLELITRLTAPKTDNSGAMNEMFMMMMKMQTDQANAQRADDIRRQEAARSEQIRQDDIRRNDKKESDERFEKMMITISAANEDKSDPVQEILRIQAAEERGYDKAMSTFESIEEKAEKRAEQLAEKSGDSSITDKALGAIMAAAPQVTSFLAAKANQSSVTSEQVAQAQELTQINHVEPVQTNFGMGSAPVSEDSAPIVDNSQNVSIIDETPVINRETKIKMAKQTVLDLSLPVIGECIMGGISPYVAATKVIEVLDDKGFPSILVTQLFTAIEFLTIASDNGLFEMAKEDNKEQELTIWIEGLYQNVKQQTTPSQSR